MAAVGAALITAAAVPATADAAAPGPDLVVTSTQWAPVQTVAGQQVRFTAVITNKGKAATPEGVISGVGFAIDGKLQTWSDTTTFAIQPGQSVTVTANSGPTASATWQATAGRHTLRAFVDDAARIKETREDNNTRTATLDVASGLSVQTSAGGFLVQTAPSVEPSLLTTSVTGDAYAGCFDTAETLVEGTERFVTSFTVGRDKPDYGNKFLDGMTSVPAGVTRQQVNANFSRLTYAHQLQYPWVLGCASGTTPGWTGFHAASVTVTRWPGQLGQSGPALAQVTKTLDTILAI